MKSVIQRVTSAEVIVDEQCIGRIKNGVLAFIGIEKGDSFDSIKRCIDKISKLRIFEDGNGKMNLSLKDTAGELLLVSQFTLAANCQKGNRPSFDNAEKPEIAKQMYLDAIEYGLSIGLKVERGQFQADMKVHLVNDGPVTFVLEY